MAMAAAMAELWQGTPMVAQSEMRLTKGMTVGVARWEGRSKVRRSYECGRLRNGAAVSVGELGGASATATASAVSKGSVRR